jgi:hypothetical protein
MQDFQSLLQWDPLMGRGASPTVAANATQRCDCRWVGIREEITSGVIVRQLHQHKALIHPTHETEINGSNLVSRLHGDTALRGDTL